MTTPVFPYLPLTPLTAVSSTAGYEKRLYQGIPSAHHCPPVYFRQNYWLCRFRQACCCFGNPRILYRCGAGSLPVGSGAGEWRRCDGEYSGAPGEPAAVLLRGAKPPLSSDTPEPGKPLPCRRSSRHWKCQSPMPLLLPSSR